MVPVTLNKDGICSISRVSTNSMRCGEQSFHGNENLGHRAKDLSLFMSDRFLDDVAATLALTVITQFNVFRRDCQSISSALSGMKLKA